jgi:sec-independent protein translocase protein TatA
MGFGFGPGQIFLLALVILLLFGKRIPEMMGSMGKGVKEFKKGLDGIEEEPEEKKPAESEKKETSDTEA